MNFLHVKILALNLFYSHYEKIAMLIIHKKAWYLFVFLINLNNNQNNISATIISYIIEKSYGQKYQLML